MTNLNTFTTHLLVGNITQAALLLNTTCITNQVFLLSLFKDSLQDRH